MQKISKELEAFIEYISVVKALSQKSIEAYLSDLSSIEGSATKTLIELQTVDILNILKNIENKRTLNRKLSSLNAFYNFCYTSNFSSEKLKFKFSKIPQLLPKFLSYEEIISKLNQIEKKSWIQSRDYALILFLFASGLRISEALNIQASDFEYDEEGGLWLKVRHAKGDKERYVPIAKNAYEAIKEYLKIRDEEKNFSSNYIWLNYQGKQLSRVSAFKITQKYLGVSPHVLRHSYATSLILGGADLRVVQELLGHESLLTTQVYTHIQKQHLQDTVLQHHPLA